MIYRCVFQEVVATPVDHDGTPYMVVTAGVRPTLMSREAFDLLYAEADVSGEDLPDVYVNFSCGLDQVQREGKNATEIAAAIAGNGDHATWTDEMIRARLRLLEEPRFRTHRCVYEAVLSSDGVATGEITTYVRRTIQHADEGLVRRALDWLSDAGLVYWGGSPGLWRRNR